jgi:hypothetical protein
MSKKDWGVLEPTILPRLRASEAIGGLPGDWHIRRFADPCAQCRQLMQQPAFVLARLDGVLLTREPVDNVDTHAGLPDTVAQLRREIPLPSSSGAIRTWVPPSPNSTRMGLTT